MVMKLLKRNNVKLKGDLILAATADEEKGGEAGAGWLVLQQLTKKKAERRGQAGLFAIIQKKSRQTTL